MCLHPQNQHQRQQQPQNPQQPPNYQLPVISITPVYLDINAIMVFVLKIIRKLLNEMICKY
ncbi:unnamed protein product [Meloidogyne enterolobii]|uniref:Uncharacterized protein n=1 Tax=Meloidogyne enterolobii TaxID=390850 RepID=A0ACB0ZFP1_MELEN